MSIERGFYGRTADRRSADKFTLRNLSGMEAVITNFGGTILELRVPDKNGKLEDVVLGYDSLDGYVAKGPYFGAIIGRFANRIEKGTFELNGIEYKVAQNDGANHLHGGIIGFDKVLWEAETTSGEDFDSLELSYLSKDGEEGYPGDLRVKVVYTLTKDNALEIHYFAVSDQDTVINLTNHAYFNLSGHCSGSILGHSLRINADKFTVNNEESLPTGEIKSVKGTPMDFQEFTVIGDVIEKDYDQLSFGNGFDHNWVLNVGGKIPEYAAEVYDEVSGRVLTVYTTKPGIQLYTGNYLDEAGIGKGGIKYTKNDALCLETQYFPNSTKHKHFPSPILRAGEEYMHTTIYKFEVK